MLAGVVLVVLLEGVSWGLLVLADRGFDLQIRRTSVMLAEQRARVSAFLDSESREMLDPVLGWTNRPGFSGGDDLVNAAGMRAVRNPAPESSGEVLRLAAFGDSFVYGSEVGPPEVWSERLERGCPGVEVLNFGVPAYGTDQAFLRFEQEGRWDADRVLIGFAPVNVRRNVNVYRPFIHDREWPRVKPRFREAPDGALQLVPNPLPTPDDHRRLVDDARATVLELGAHDHWFRPWIWRNPLYDFSATVRLLSFMAGRLYVDRIRADRLLDDGFFNPDSEPFRLQVRLLAAFHRAVEEGGGEGVVVIFPDGWALDRLARGEAPPYATIVADLERRGVPLLDLSTGFLEEGGLGGARGAGLDRFFAPGGHYSREGNEAVARELCRQLVSPDPSRP